MGRQLFNRTFNSDARDILEVNGDWTHSFSPSCQPVRSVVLRLAVTNILEPSDGKLPSSGACSDGV